MPPLLFLPQGNCPARLAPRCALAPSLPLPSLNTPRLPLAPPLCLSLPCSGYSSESISAGLRKEKHSVALHSLQYASIPAPLRFKPAPDSNRQGQCVDRANASTGRLYCCHGEIAAWPPDTFPHSQAALALDAERGSWAINALGASGQGPPDPRSRVRVEWTLERTF
jgi:hypothetical protein